MGRPQAAQGLLGRAALLPRKVELGWAMGMVLVAQAACSALDEAKC